MGGQQPIESKIPKTIANTPRRRGEKEIRAVLTRFPDLKRRRVSLGFLGLASFVVFEFLIN